MVGEIGPWYLERVCDDDSSPRGYRLRKGISLLINPEHQAAYRKLPNEFSFKQAKEAYGKKDEATTSMLKKCIRVGILNKVRHGWYAKVPE